MFSMLIGTFSMNIIVAGAMNMMLAFLNALQMVIHLPMINVLVPSNVSLFNQLIIPIVMFDILDPEYTSKLMF